MKKIISLVLIVVMVLGCISLVACGGGGGGAAPPPGGGEETTPPGEEETTPPEETLGDILGRGEGIEAVEYDMVITAPGVPTMTQHWWVKENKVRIEMTEEGQDIVTLLDMDAQTMYVYMPEENMAYKMTFAPTTQSAMEEAQSITDYDYHEIGTETLDGKVCLVVEYTIPAEQATAKAWIWKEHGFLIRIETTMAGDTTIVEFKNIDFGDISDSMFELPEGVEVFEMG